MIYFTAHTFKCVCHCRRAMFRVLGMYNFGACKKSPRFTKQNFCDKCLNEFFVLEIFLETFYVDYQNHN